MSNVFTVETPFKPTVQIQKTDQFPWSKNCFAGNTMDIGTRGKYELKISDSNGFWGHVLHAHKQ